MLDAACLAFHCIGARLQGRAPKWFLVALNLMCGCGLASLFSLSSPSCVASLLFLCCPLLVLPSSSLSLPPSVSLVASLPSPLSPLLPRLRGSSGELFKTALWVMIVPEKKMCQRCVKQFYDSYITAVLKMIHSRTTVYYSSTTLALDQVLSA